MDYIIPINLQKQKVGKFPVAGSGSGVKYGKFYHLKRPHRIPTPWVGDTRYYIQHVTKLAPAPDLHWMDTAGKTATALHTCDDNNNIYPRRPITW